MRVAVMQPYLFPYLGYYQLVCCANKFVLYDDATFIKQGWINRNRILAEGNAMRITVPVVGASSYIKIRNLEFSTNISKVLRTFKHAYRKAPGFDHVYPIFERVLTHKERDITTVCHLGIQAVFDYLGVKKEVLRSSDLDYDRDSPRAERLIAICEALGGTEYVNSLGGQNLYSKEFFEQHGYKLSFLRMDAVEYPQGGKKFVPNLSILDILMWCDRQQALTLLEEYQLV